MSDLIVSFYPYKGIWTYYNRNTPNIIIKGPYDPEDDLYNQILYRSETLKKWKTPFIMHPLKTKEKKNMMWISFPNALGHFPSSWHKHRQDGYSYLMSDELLPTLSKVDESNRQYYTADLLLAYVHLYIIGSNDHHPFTTLIDHNGNIVIADYTGVQDEEMTHEMFYINREKYNKDIYRLLRPFYLEIANDISELDVGEDQEMIHRKNMAIDLLLKYQ